LWRAAPFSLFLFGCLVFRPRGVGLTRWAIDVVGSLGLAGLAGIIALENLFPPIPSEVALPLAGFLVARSTLSFPAAVGAATAGGLLGALILYWVGRRIGWDSLCNFVSRHGRWLLVTQGDLDRTNEWFERYGHRAVLVARLVPGARSLVSIPAGASRMQLRRFVIYTTLGSAAWNAILIALGWVVGSNWRAVTAYGRVFGYVATAALVGVGVWLVWRRRRNIVQG